MDKTYAQTTLVKMNEILLNENGEWLHFAQPYHIIAAEKLEDVLLALHEIERLIKVNNWYAAGFLSYEAAPAFDPALQTHASAGFPYLWFGLYPKPRSVALPKPNQDKETLNWHPTIDRDTYDAAIERIKTNIAEGWTYQVNYTMRLQTEFAGSAWDFFLHLAQNQNNHAAYVDTGRYIICSASPELFFELNGASITCRPMKGTVKRGRTTAEDAELAEWLKHSVKNRAENVMIVDMLRNDLGRIAEIGSVHVPELFSAERYPTLWQMTSTVTAKTNASLADIFSALFPCGSITGAPKVSTMKIIAELENTPRKIYTGSIGYIAPPRKAKFSVAIRTALIDCETRQAEYGVGGGIVWDSTSADEYEEALLKARVLTQPPATFSLLETLLWTPEESCFLREKHTARMTDSAAYFGIPISKEKLDDFLDRISSRFDSPQRVRILLDQNGGLDSESKPFQSHETHDALKACLAKSPIDSSDVFLFHKTTRRDLYEAALNDNPGYEDVLLYNEHGELAEFTIGNLVVELNGRLFTPPVSCGLLPGTFRAHLMATGQVMERTIPVWQLKDCSRVFRVNSIRRWQAVDISISRKTDHRQFRSLVSE